MSRKKNLALAGNPRYQPKSLTPIFGYDNLMVPVAEVELAGLDVLADIGLIPAKDYRLLTPKIRRRVLSIRTSLVDELERTVTKHDIRALVRLIQEILPEPLGRWAHIPFTSYDPLETGRTLQYSKAHTNVINPLSTELIKVLAELVHRYAKVLQIGRTHGQHALPITVGFWLATILNRIIYNCQQADIFAASLVGKITGAVGCSNAIHGLGIAQKCQDIPFEERVLTKLGLKAARISTQILQPEPLAYYLFSNVMLSAVLGQFGRDGRNLMRSEIAEIGEPFAKGQVGSSTMAQKRNPINFENTEGMWLRTKNEFGKVLDSLTSEHQRDLVNSSLYRDFPIILVNLVTQMNTLLRKDKEGKTFLSRITVNEVNCRKNFRMSAKFILAEPIYIALQMAGYRGDAHELVNRQAMPISQRDNQPLIYAVKKLANHDSVLAEALANIPSEALSLFEHPENYTGDASSQALEIADAAADYVGV
jgi:adenylosuccinate lyase